MTNIDFSKTEKINVDVVVGFGAACRVAEALKRNNLRFFSSPFDWMMCYNLDTVISLLKKIKNKKKPRFFVNCREEKKYTTENCKGIVDCDSGMVSMHDFPKDMEIEKASKFLYLKYITRFKNLDTILKTANSICFLTDRNIPLDKMKSFAQSMRKLYKLKKIFYINIYDTCDANEESYERLEDEGVTYFIYRFNDEHKNGCDKKTNPDFWRGNIDYWDKILNKVKLNKKFKDSYKLKRRIFSVSFDVSAQKSHCILRILGLKFKFKIML